MIGPDEVKAEAERLAEQNFEFWTFLRNFADGDGLDTLFLKFHKEIFANYDCRKCANCCKTYDITLGADEIWRMADLPGYDEGQHYRGASCENRPER